MTTVVIAAHNEGAVLGACLDALRADAAPGELEVIVAANGCTDDTVAVARSRSGVVVVQTEVASKTAALNAADAVATGYPRVYLDADIPASAGTLRALAAALDGPDAPLVATGDRHLEVTGRPLLVRCYFAIQRRLPVFEEGLFGRGLIAVSERGRARFGVFPDVVADDLFLDSLFAPTERVRLPGVSTTVATPLRTRDLVRRLVRVRHGNAVLRGRRSTPVREPDRWSWLRDVVLPRPWLAPAGAAYVVITLVAALLARREPPAGAAWGRDESTRVAS